jgi:hypothetical protein
MQNNGLKIIHERRKLSAYIQAEYLQFRDARVLISSMEPKLRFYADNEVY